MKKIINIRNVLFSLIFILTTIIGFSQDFQIKVGDKIPEFKYSTLDGKELDSKDLLGKGKKIIINFTATWCPYCKEEKIKFSDDYNNVLKNKKDIETVIMFGNYGRGEKADTIEKVQEYLKENNYKFPSYFDKDKKIIMSFGLKSIPTTILVNEKGIVEEIGEEYYKLEKIQEILKK